MIQVDASASQYFNKLIAQQEIAGLGIRLRAVNGGTTKGDCKLEFCEAEEVRSDDYVIECDGFLLYVDQKSAPFLDQTEVSYQTDATGGQLTIKAPKLKLTLGARPAADASIVERIQYVIDSEINPGVASHGGRVSLLEVSADGVVVLQFGGGCQGCGMKDVTLKQGIEKTLREQIPEITAIVDATDHAAGATPYYRANAS